MQALQKLISSVLAIDPEAPAVQFQGRWHSWAEIAAVIDQVERALSQAGFGADTRIGVLLRNRPEILAAVVAVHHANACLVALNAALPDERLADGLKETATPVIIGAKDDLARTMISQSALAQGALVLCVDFNAERAGCVRVIAKRDPAVRHLRDTAPGVAMEMLTSGTTGPPKRVSISREGQLKNLLRRQLYGATAGAKPRLPAGVQILTSPFAHASGVGQLMGAVITGRKVCLLSKFNVEAVQAAIVEHRPKVLSLPPTGWRMLYDANVPPSDLASLKAARTGTAPLDAAFAEAFQARYGIPILQNYGSTETGGVAGWTLDDFNQHGVAKRGAVGRLNADVEGRIVDPESGAVLAPGEQGLLELRSAELGPDWVRTTDLAKLDNDRFLWICGRHDGAIIRGGFKLQPEEIARALEAHPAVSEAVVVGLPDARLGQVPAAAFTVAPGATPPSQGEMIEFSRSRLTSYQAPVAILPIDEFPRTVSLKVDQRALSEWLLARIERAAV